MNLLESLNLVYLPLGFKCGQIKEEAESQDYGASSLEINNCRVQFRTGKITPTKVGLFTTLWKRIAKGPIQPFDEQDPIDLFVISVRKGLQWGQFVFPKKVLCEKGIVSSQGKEGKRAMRIYPPWGLAPNPQAKKTQSWQSAYFFEIHPTRADSESIRKLFSDTNL